MESTKESTGKFAFALISGASSNDFTHLSYSCARWIPHFVQPGDKPAAVAISFTEANDVPLLIQDGVTGHPVDVESFGQVLMRIDVNLDRNVIVQRLRHLRIAPGIAVHVLAVSAPGGGEIREHRLVRALRFQLSGREIGAPGNGVLRVPKAGEIREDSHNQHNGEDQPDGAVRAGHDAIVGDRWEQTELLVCLGSFN